jgi:hypothetical protein
MPKPATLPCPSGDGLGEMLIPMDDVYRADSRRAEIKLINRERAPELIECFSEAIQHTGNLILAVAKHRAFAERRLAARQAVIRLDLSEAELKRRGHSKSSVDLRESLFVLDEECEKWVELVGEITAVEKMLDLQKEAFTRAYFTASKYGDDRKIGRETGLSHPAPADPTSTAPADDDPLPGWAGGKATSIESQFGA